MIHLCGHRIRIHAYIAFLPWVVMGGNVIIDFNTSHHLTLLLCYTGHFDENKTVDIVSVAICVRLYHLKTVLPERGL